MLTLANLDDVFMDIYCTIFNFLYTGTFSKRRWEDIFNRTYYIIIHIYII